jgi:cytoskeletal protein CcmA (bactofilin family)
LATQQQFRLGPNDSLDGRLVFDGSLRVEGHLSGEVECTGDVNVGEDAQAEARIAGEEVTVRGRVRGDVLARTRVRLLGRAVLEGDVSAPRLAVEGGATLNGRVSMPAKQ